MDLVQESFSLLERLDGDGKGSLKHYNEMVRIGVLSSDTLIEIKRLQAILSWFMKNDEVEDDHLSLILDILSSKLEEADKEINKFDNDLYRESPSPSDMLTIIHNYREKDSSANFNCKKISKMCHKYIEAIAALVKLDRTVAS